MVHRLDDLQRDRFVRKQADRPAGISGRRFGTSECNELGFALAVEYRFSWGRLALLAFEHRLQPFENTFLAHALDPCHVCMQRGAE